MKLLVAATATLALLASSAHAKPPPRPLVVNKEVPVGAEVDLGKLGEFVFTASCTAQGGGIFFLVAAVNNTPELLLIYERDGTLHDIASRFPLDLWGGTVVPPEISVTRDGAAGFPLATQEQRNVYSFELTAAVLDGSACRFTGRVEMFVGPSAFARRWNVIRQGGKAFANKARLK
jgi:hypothetical protein